MECRDTTSTSIIVYPALSAKVSNRWLSSPLASPKSEFDVFHFLIPTIFHSIRFSFYIRVILGSTCVQNGKNVFFAFEHTKYTRTLTISIQPLVFVWKNWGLDRNTRTWTDTDSTHLYCSFPSLLKVTFFWEKIFSNETATHDRIAFLLQNGESHRQSWE